MVAALLQPWRQQARLRVQLKVGGDNLKATVKNTAYTWPQVQKGIAIGWVYAA